MNQTNSKFGEFRMTAPYSISRYDRNFRLLGTSLKACLTRLKQVLDQPETGRGTVFYITGQGGMGKSEILEQLRFYFYNGEDSPLAAVKKNVGGWQTEPPAQAQPLLFGGIIDLYNPAFYFGRGIKRQLIDSWCQDYQWRQDYFARHTSPTGPLKTPEEIFNGYTKEDDAFSRLRFALPKFSHAISLIQDRNLELDRLYKEHFTELCQYYTPVICLDTAELLAQINYSGKPALDPDDTWNWLTNFLQSEERAKCITIIAGRPIEEKLKLVEKDLPQSVEQILKQIVPQKLELQYLDYLTPTEIIEYVRQYCEVNELFPLEGKTDLEIWQMFCQGATEVDPALDGSITAEKISQLTEGRPLLVDGFCYAVHRLNQVPGLTIPPTAEDTDGSVLEITPKEHFRYAIVQLLVPRDENEVRVQVETATAAQVQRVLVYAALARRGLDAYTIEWLSKQEQTTLGSNHAPISYAVAVDIIEALKRDSFIKVREEVQDNLSRIFLHDEVYHSLNQYINELIAENEQLVALMAAAFDYSSYFRSLSKAERKRDHIRQVSLKPEEIFQPQTKRLWFETDNTSQDNTIKRFLAENRRVQDLQVEQLYYYLKRNYYNGYDHYCRLANNALAEYDVNFYTRLKRELLRFEKDNQWQTAAADPFFKVIRNFEGELRQHKRAFQYEWVTPDNQSDKTWRGLEALARSTIKQLLDKQGKLVYPKTAHGELDEVKLSPAQSQSVRRLRLALADAKISVYEYQSLPPAEAELQAILQLIEDKESIGANQAEDYQVWLRNIVLARTYDRLGSIRLNNYDTPNAIRLYKLALEYIKQAQEETELYLNETRNNIAYAYSWRGRKSIAIEICDLALKNQLYYGHEIYIALCENVMARVYLTSNSTLEQAYQYAQQALLRFVDKLKPADLLNLKPKELKKHSAKFRATDLDKLQVYKIVLITLAKVLHRLLRTRFGAVVKNPDKVSYLAHLKKAQATILAYLLEALDYFVEFERSGQDGPPKILTSKVDEVETVVAILKEIGGVYRTTVQLLEEEFRDELEAKQSQLYQVYEWNWIQAGTCFKQIETICSEYEAKGRLRYQQLENLLDLAQLNSYKVVRYDTASHKEKFIVQEVEDSFNAVEKGLVKLEPNPDELEDNHDLGQALSYCLINGKLRMRRADWEWQKYIQLGRLRNLPIQNAKRSAYFKQYLTHQIYALGWFVRYQPDLINATGDYSRDLNFIGRIEEKLHQSVQSGPERELARAVALELLTQADPQKATLPPQTPDNWLEYAIYDPYKVDLQGGVRLFAYIVDIDSELGFLIKTKYKYFAASKTQLGPEEVPNKT